MAFDISAPQNFPVRPLSGGMIQDLPTNGLPNGAFLRIQNYQVQKYGLKKRGGYNTFDINSSNYFDESLYDIAYFYKRSGGAEMVYIGDKRIYKRTGSNTVTPIPITSTEVIYISNSAYDSLTQSYAMEFENFDADLIRSGDVLLDDSGTVVGEIVNVSSATLTLYTADSTVEANMYLEGDNFSVAHYLSTEPRMAPSYAVLPVVQGQSADKMVITDQSGRGLYLYDGGSSLSNFVVDTSTDHSGSVYSLSGKALTYFSDRLWLGNTEEQDGEFPQRIRWSEPTQFDWIPLENYIDLPYSEGKLLALVPLGSLLVAYYEDAIYIGRETSIIGLPYTFERLETGNVGLVNSKAVVRWIDGHFFVGQDDIYFLSGSTGIQQVGSPVLEGTIRECRRHNLLDYVQVEHDPRSDSIAFLFPDVSLPSLPVKTISTKLWRYYYISQAWAYDEVAYADTTTKTSPRFYYTGLLPSKTYIGGETWGDWIDKDPSLDGPYEEDPQLVRWLGEPDGVNILESFQEYNSWTDLAAEELLPTNMKLAVWWASENKQIVVQEEDDLAQDTFGTTEYPVWCLLESADFDFGTPDSTKTVTRLSIKTDKDLAIEFLLYNSDRMGITYKRPERLRSKPNYNEGHADFLCTGSTYRFKLINNQAIDPYRISEAVIRVIGRGLQITN